MCGRAGYAPCSARRRVVALNGSGGCAPRAVHVQVPWLDAGCCRSAPGAPRIRSCGIAGVSRCNDLINKDETYLSAQQSAAKADPRVPRPDGVAQRTPRAQTPAHQGTPSPDRFDPTQAARVESGDDAGFGTEHRLHRRADFLLVRRSGIRTQTAHFVVYLVKLPDQTAARLGLAVSRQVGNAVVRNRIKRRLRESFRCSLRPVLGPGWHDHGDRAPRCGGTHDPGGDRGTEARNLTDGEKSRRISPSAELSVSQWRDPHLPRRQPSSTRTCHPLPS